MTWTWEREKCRCKDCGSIAWWCYMNADFPVVMKRSEAREFDMWVFCENRECSHAYGQGIFDQDEHLVTWVGEWEKREVKT